MPHSEGAGETYELVLLMAIPAPTPMAMAATAISSPADMTIKKTFLRTPQIVPCLAPRDVLFPTERSCPTSGSSPRPVRDGPPHRDADDGELLSWLDGGVAEVSWPAGRGLFHRIAAVQAQVPLVSERSYCFSPVSSSLVDGRATA